MTMLEKIFGMPKYITSSSFSPEKESIYYPPIIALDIGCRWGFAERFIQPEVIDKFKIFGFDPDIDECERLRNSYKNLPDGRVTCVPVGLAGASGKRDLYLTKDPACSSLHPPLNFLATRYPALSCIEIDKCVSIDVVSLLDWALAAGVNSLDYIKIDTQGSELEILKGAGDLLMSTKCIDIEVEFNPIYKGQSLFAETDIYLRSKGLVLWRLSNLVHYSVHGASMPIGDTHINHYDGDTQKISEACGGQLFWADARYVRSDIIHKASADATQCARDILLFHVLGMPDVVEHMKRIRSAE